MVEVVHHRHRHRRGLWLAAVVIVVALAIPFGPAVVRSASKTKPFPIDLHTVGTRCRDDADWVCGSIDVPLERAHPQSEQITIRFRILPRREAAEPSAGTIVVVNGGPGDPSMRQHIWAESAFSPALANHDLLLVDNRGSGASDRIDCPAAEKTFSAVSIAQCRKSLGSRADDFGTVAAVDDLEAVLQRVHAGAVDLYGESYGTFFAQVFALRYPQHLKRLVLDGPVPLDDDPFRIDSLQAGLAGLDATCRAHPKCIAAGGFPSLMAESLAAIRTDPRNYTPSAGADDLALLVANAGRAGSAYRELPAALRSYMAGDSAPLFRVLNEASNGGSGDAVDPANKSSVGLLIADQCTDYREPFDLRAPLAEQKKQLARSVTAASKSLADRVKPFTPTEALRRDGSLCLGWPAPTGPTPQTLERHFPDVPTLVLRGELDTVTPSHGAHSVAAEFPDSRYLELPWQRHIAALTDRTKCAADIASQFLAATAIDTTCTKRLIAPPAVDAFPMTYAGEQPIDVIASQRATPSVDDRRTLGVVRDAISDVMWRWARLFDDHGPGLRAGTFRTETSSTPGDSRLHLDEIGWTVDTAVSGDITSDPRTSSFAGVVEVTTPTGLSQLRVRCEYAYGASTEETISGSLGGHDIHVEVDAKLGL